MGSQQVPSLLWVLSRYPQIQKTGKPNNSKIFGSNITQRPKQDSKEIGYEYK